ncbi:hypothetical protein P7C73_g4035, partial [Tremellales sp. Uapishka_1]
MSTKQVAGGHKANLKNEGTSDESKEHSKEVIEDLKESGETEAQDHTKNEVGPASCIRRVHPADIARITSSADTKVCRRLIAAADSVAALKNPSTGEEAREHAKQVLEEHGVEYEEKKEKEEEPKKTTRKGVEAEEE